MLPVHSTRIRTVAQSTPKTALIDLRRYGMAYAAPNEDGHKMLTFIQDERGALRPAA